MYRIYEDDPDQCMQLCQGLLDEPNIDTAVRLGDVYGLMIEHYGQTGDYKQVKNKYCKSGNFHCKIFHSQWWLQKLLRPVNFNAVKGHSYKNFCT